MATTKVRYDPDETNDGYRVHDDNDGNDIVIERREIVGRVTPSPTGSESMIATAYLRIGQYMTENAGGMDAINVEFVYRGATFHASYTPEGNRDA